MPGVSRLRGRSGMTGLPMLAPLLASLLGAALGCIGPLAVDKNVVHDSDVRGCARGPLEASPGLDVVIVVDTSQSTLLPTGADVDRDGLVGELESSIHTDRDDSRLAAQVAAIRSLFRSLAGGDTRFSIVTFAGPNDSPGESRPDKYGSRRHGRVATPLTHDPERLDRALDEVLARGSAGATVFYAGMHRANQVLDDDSYPGRRKVVLFLSDSPTPTIRRINGTIGSRDPRMKTAARWAQEHGIVFHTFGLSRESKGWRTQTLGRIAGATGGTYHAVTHPDHFYCHLARTLAPPRRAAPRLPGWPEAYAGPTSPPDESTPLEELSPAP